MNMTELTQKEQISAELFNYLKNGKLLNENDIEKKNRNLYKFAVAEQEELIKVYKQLGFVLVFGDGYCYLTNNQITDGVYNKIITLISYLEFLDGFDINLEIGENFSITKILSGVETSVNEQKRLRNITKNSKQTTYEDRIKFILKEFIKLGILAKKNNENNEYIILNGFNYIKKFFENLELKETNENN